MSSLIKSCMFIVLFTILCGACKNQSIDYTLFEITDEQVQPDTNSVAITGTYSFTGEVNGMKINLGLDDILSDAIPYPMNLEGCDFSVGIDSLRPNTTYYYCYSIDFGHKNDYLLEVRSFTTLHGVPDVETVEVIRYDSTSYYVKGRVVSDNGSPITERGICWNTSGNPNPLTDSVIRYGENGVGEYQCLLSHLDLNTKHYVCAYAKNEKNMGIGRTLEFQTEIPPERPTVITAEIYEITTTTAIGGGEVVDDGLSPVTSCGVCWSTVPNPTIENDSTVDGSGLGPFVSSLTNLIPNTTYYVRAYATNIKGTAYGLPVSFTTLDIPIYTITVSANPANGGTVTSGGDFHYGDSCTVTAIPAIGYSFLRWTENGSQVSIDANYTFSVTDDRTLVAQFQQQNYTISVSANPTNCGTVTGGGEFHYGDSCTVIATPANGHTFLIWTENGQQVSANTRYSFIVTDNCNLVANFDVHEYVDLGLPSGTLWATCNIGAATPEDYGDYFAWGETTTKDLYDWHTYRYCNGTPTTLTKYCDDANYGYNDFTDNLTVLEESDDAATVNWGANWRTPSKEEWDELRYNTTKIWTTQNGVNGYLFTARNGRTLFLPAAGYHDYNLNSDGSGYYWSNSLNTGTPYYSGYLFFNSSTCNMYDHFRSYGRSVRPVRSALKK